MDYPILSDPTCEVAKTYGLVDANRKVPQRWTFYIGKDGKILHIDKGVKSDQHGADIATKLGELNIPKKS